MWVYTVIGIIESRDEMDYVTRVTSLFTLVNFAKWNSRDFKIYLIVKSSQARAHKHARARAFHFKL